MVREDKKEAKGNRCDFISPPNPISARCSTSPVDGILTATLCITSSLTDWFRLMLQQRYSQRPRGDQHPSAHRLINGQANRECIYK